MLCVFRVIRIIRVIPMKELECKNRFLLNIKNILYLIFFILIT